MKVKDLIKKLQKFDQDLDIWYDSDIAIGNGGVKTKDAKIVQAYEAGLDEDDIGDEYHYIDELNNKQIEKFIKQGYKKVKGSNVVSKDVVILT